jgi:hypothetical protein
MNLWNHGDGVPETFWNHPFKYSQLHCTMGLLGYLFIATGYGLDDREVGIRVLAGSRIFSLDVVQSGPGVHPTSYPMGTGDFFPRG